MIRKRLAILGILLIGSVFLFAQEPTEVGEKIESIGDLSGNALFVNIHRADEKTILKELKSTLKDKNGEVKTNRKGLTATNVSFPLVSDSTFTIEAEIEENKKLEYSLMVIFQYNGSILSSVNNPGGFNSAKAFLFELGNRLSKEANEKNVSEQEKELENLEKDLENLERKLEKEEKQIEKSKKQIKKNQGIIHKIDKEKTLDEKLINSRSKNEKDILKGKKEIKDAEYNIEINKKDQKKKIEEIKEQKKVLEKAKKSLDVFK